MSNQQLLIIKKIIRLIKKNDNFLITAHMNLEGDALGSELALYLLLKKLNKKVFILNHDQTPAAYNFLPKSSSINKFSKNHFDIVFALDCSDITRIGSIKDKLPKKIKIVNIDHHISNTYFGDINWVEPKASSACEMIYYLAKELNLIDKDIAVCLYTGISTDSGNFTYASTSPQTHRIAAELIQFGLKPDEIYQKVRSLCAVDDLRFIAKNILKLKFTCNQKVCWVPVPKWPKKDYDLSEIFFTTMRLLKQPQLFILFKKLDNKRTRVNFRSRREVDVNKIAKVFGGGGHCRASGTTLDLDLKQAQEKVISFIKKRYQDGRKKV